MKTVPYAGSETPVESVRRAKAEGRVHPLFRSKSAQSRWLNSLSDQGVVWVEVQIEGTWTKMHGFPYGQLHGTQTREAASDRASSCIEDRYPNHTSRLTHVAGLS